MSPIRDNRGVGSKKVRTIETIMRCISRSLLAPYVNNNDDNSDTLICMWMVNVEGEFRIGRRVMATRRDCYMNATVGQSISLGCVRER